MGLNSLNFSPFFLSGLPGVELNQSLKKSVTIHPDQLPWAGQGCGEDWREELQGPVKEPVRGYPVQKWQEQTKEKIHV